MTGRGITSEMLFAACACGGLAFFLMRKSLSTPWAALVTIVKIAIPLVYFGYFYDGTWQIVDDVLYHDLARSLLTAGYNPITVFTDPAARSILLDASNGPVLLYWWWNVLAEWIFGIHYYSPVFVNVPIAAVTAVYIYRLTLLGGFPVQYARLLAVFSTLHWDLLLWSAFLNLKDLSVVMLTAAALFYLLQLSAQRGIGMVTASMKLLIVLVLLSTIRFYVGVLLLISYSIWLLLRVRRLSTYLSWLVAGLVALLLVRRYFKLFNWFDLNVVGIVVGMIHFVLTPQPWSIEPNYSFVFIPSVLHWIFAVPAAVGMWLAWRRSRNLRLLVIYFVVVTLFYAAVPDLQGPRQRLQVSFIWAWFEFHFFYLILTPAGGGVFQPLPPASTAPLVTRAS